MTNIDFNKFSSTPKKIPPMLAIYGDPGLGKTTFAAAAPKPIILDLEGGSYNLSITRVEPQDLQTSSDVLDILRGLYAQQHEFETVILDSLDFLENMIKKEIVKQHKVQSINDIKGYGTGYAALENRMDSIIHALAALKERKKMQVIMTCHSAIKTHIPADGDQYQQYVLNLRPKTGELLEKICDFVLFAKKKVYVTSTEAGFGKSVRRAHDSGERVIAIEPNPSYVAKNRWGLPGELPLDYQAFWSAVQSSNGYKQAEVQPAKAKTGKVVPITTTTTTPSMGTSPAAYQNANGVYNHAEYLEL